ncbi:uncharacterized protein LOC119080198 [Bradysia coprophila]|uniref:uncharacterized protein LOC119080198 n=1 Tax=Bradysia coprophila TaxID=38358 RepID=UPI00187DA032|nr:uncharacterized protein LOC119080198 [Bradysia coprophila]
MSEFFRKSKRGRGKAKHEILDRYLKAFFAIQCQSVTWDTPVLYVDGFAGPGTYKTEDENSNEEIGSPIVAYQAASEHTLIGNFNAKHNKILLIFVEKNAALCRKLEKNLARLQSTKTEVVREVVQFRVVNDDFKSYLDQLLSSENEEFSHSPMFVFADPFGYGGESIPMKSFKKLMERQDGKWLPTEVFITVMDGFARRFISDSRQSSSINALMGYENWHYLTEQDNLTPEQRRTEFIKLYIDNLVQGIPKALVLKFSMRNNNNRHVYHLIFLTSHIKGIKSMKEAMWKKTQNATEMVFSEWMENRNASESIIDKTREQVARCLSELIKNEFSGLTVRGSKLELYIWLETPYISNVKNNLKKLFKTYAINSERAFEKIKYQFPGEPKLLRGTVNRDEDDILESILSESLRSS